MGLLEQTVSKVTRCLLIHQYKIQTGYKNQNNLYKVGNSRPITQNQDIQKDVIIKIKILHLKKDLQQGII